MFEEILTAIANILTPITIGVWLAVIPLLFYYFFVLGNQSEEEGKKRIMYGWGIKVYIAGLMLFTIANVFFTRSLDEFSSFCASLVAFFTSLGEYLPQILGVIFWVLTILFFVFFFVVRRPLKKKKLEEEGTQ